MVLRHYVDDDVGIILGMRWMFGAASKVA